jgi:predicted phosphodiesterase
MSRKRLAILADIHGNLPALKAVMADIESLSPDEVLVGGDLVGRGPQGSAVIGEIVARDWPSIRGNHEDYLLSFRRGEVPAEWWEQEEWAASRWMAAELTESDVAYLETLPFSLSARPAPGLLLTHGSPRSHSEGLGPWSSDRKLEKLLGGIEETTLVCGHTHRPMQRRVNSGQVINVGSVGLPFNGDQRAQYAILEWDGTEWSAEFRQVEYDLEEILEIYRSSGFLDQGGATAELLVLELRHAAPFLVPFLKWVEALGLAPVPEQIPVFLDLYDPGEPVHEFFVHLDALIRDRR